MKLQYSLLVLVIALVYGIIKNFWPDFPIPEEYLLLFAFYVLGKLGVEIIEPAIRRGLVRAGASGFELGSGSDNDW